MPRYAYIIPSSYDYIPGLAALLASIEKYTPNVDIVLVSYDIPTDFLTSLGKFTFNVIDKPQSEPDQKLATIIERFRVTAEVMPNYDAICFMDADMFLLGDVILFFDIAAKGFIVTAHNGGIIGFTKEHQRLGKADLGVDNYIYTKTHTAVPVFASALDADWFAAVYRDYDRNALDDYTLLNLKGIQLEKFKRMISLPSYAFTGIHHWQLKPETSLMRMGNLVLTGTEEQPYMTHGKWWDKGWIDSLMQVAERHLVDFGYNPGYVRPKIWTAFDILLKEYKGLTATFSEKTGIDIFMDFEKFCTMTTIDLTNYRTLMASDVVKNMPTEFDKPKLTEDARPEFFQPETSSTQVELVGKKPAFTQEISAKEAKLIETYFEPFPLLQGFSKSWDWVTDVNHSNPFYSPIYYLICKGMKAVTIVSIECADGYTAYMLAQAAKEVQGLYFVIESDKDSYDRIETSLISDDIPYRAFYGDVLELKPFGDILDLDFVLIDGRQSSERLRNIVSYLYPKMTINGYIAVHDIFGVNFDSLTDLLTTTNLAFEWITMDWNYGLVLLKKMNPALRTIFVK